MNRNKRGESFPEAFFTIVLTGVVFIGIPVVVGSSVRKGFRAQALAAGVAHYVVDSKTGETTFEFITPEKERATCQPTNN